MAEPSRNPNLGLQGTARREAVRQWEEAPESPGIRTRSFDAQPPLVKMRRERSRDANAARKDRILFVVELGKSTSEHSDRGLEHVSFPAGCEF